MLKFKQLSYTVVILALLAGSAPFLDPAVVVADDLPMREEYSLPTSPEVEYVPDQIIVKFKETTISEAEASLNESLATEVIYTSPFAGFKVLQIPAGTSVAEMVETYSGQSIVEYAEPNYLDRITWTPNDPAYAWQWHFDQINLEAAWDLDTTAPNYGGDPGIVVAVIDSGIAYETYDVYVQAPDLANTNFWTNPGEIAGNLVDDDGNGYVDDVHGWDFVNNDAHPNDDNRHGTHVCGTIAQSTNNSSGIAGIAFNTTIMPLKAYNSEGNGDTAWIADSFYYAADNGAHIINISAGGSHSTTKENAVAYAYNQGVTIICSAGNEYDSGNAPSYPAAYDDYCIAVGATRYDQTHAYYSNTGSYLDIAAPGGDMLVDQNSDGYGDGVLQETFATGDPTTFGYYFFQGTSMACPHVSGVAALILAQEPSWTPDQVRQALESTATDLGDPGWDEVYGWGLLNAPAAVGAVSSTPPNAPDSPLCEGVTNPTGVNDFTPEFSWTFSDPDIGDTQGAYQILVASTSGNLAADNGDMWDSGKVTGSASGVSYDGTALSDYQTYYWKVKTWDIGDNEGPYCAEQQFTTATSAESAWTFMVYLDGDNNLEEAGIDDFLEMASVGSDSNVNIVVQFDRIDGYDGSYGDWTTCKRFHITPGMTPDPANALSDLGEVNMGDPATLVDFVQWAGTNYPATAYTLVLWNHGGGWRAEETEDSLNFKDVCYDDTSLDALYTDEVQAALNAISSSVGIMDIIGFDACLMGMIEVAYELRDYASVMVGSVETEPGDGWPFDTTLSDLKSNPSWTAAQLGTDIVDRYYQSYGNDEAMSAIDLSQLSSLAGSVSSFAQTMRDSWDTDEDAVKTAAQSVIDVLDTTIIHEQHGSSWPDSHGLAIYFPKTLGEFSSDYNATIIDFPADTVWEEFLADFYTSMGGSWINSARYSSQEYYVDEHIDLYDFCQGLVDYVPCPTYTESLVSHEFINSGVAQGWYGDDGSWLYELPFSFPFFGNDYDSVYVCSNGFLDFTSTDSDYSNSTAELMSRVMIAPVWDDLVTNGVSQTGEDIYIHQPTPDSVCIRWRAETYSGDYPVNVEVVLYQDGRIRINYGPGNTNLSPTIGISKGDSSCYYLSAYDGYSTLTEVDSDLFTPAMGGTSPNAPDSPLCEGVTNPTGVNDPTPEFSWTFSDPDGGDTQGAYQILVASTPGNLAADNGDMWDSGKVTGSDSEVSYDGTTLADNQTCYWKVKTWDIGDNEGPYCSEQQFTSGTSPSEVWVDDDWAGSSHGDPVDGHTFGTDAFATIQDGIDAVAGSTVHVAAGTYYENITLEDGVEVLGAGAGTTTIDGGGNGSVVTAVGVGSGTKLDGFTITNGSADYGGGMYNSNSSPTVTNCTFSGNTATNDGGGMYNYQSSPAVSHCTLSDNSAFKGGGMHNYENSSPTVNNCTFSGNSADSQGGGMANLINSSPTVSNCTFSGNSCTSAGSNGGGMANITNCSPTVSNCIFSGNTAAITGGGMYNYQSSMMVNSCTFSGNTADHGGGICNYSNSSPTLTNCTFSSNTVTDYGGGMYNWDNSSPTVTDCIFSGNSAGEGGGMTNMTNSSPTVTNCTLSGNTADHGGGINNVESSPTVSNCTFSGNSAAANGGGMYNRINSSPTVTNCTFSGNSANYGGGMYNHNSSSMVTNCTFSGNTTMLFGGGIANHTSSPTVVNCTFSGNSAAIGRGMYNESTSSPTVTNCILWDSGMEIYNDGTSAPVVTYCDIQGGYAGTGNINDNPMFANPGTGNYRLQAGSPCIDTGNSSAVPGWLTTDFEGDVRIEDGDGDGIVVVDMGIDEFIPMPGDANADGEIDVLDITKVARIILGWDPETPCADANLDEAINVLDMTCIAKIILGGPHYGDTYTMASPGNWTYFDEVAYPNYGGHVYATPMHLTNNELLQGDWTKGPAGTGETNWINYGDNRIDQKTGELAESWEIPQLGTIIFHIRDDVYWQDKGPANGRQMTVDDVEYSINRAMSGGYFGYFYPGLAATLEVTSDPDAWTVTCTMPVEEWINFITIVPDYMSIVCPEAIALWGDQADWEHSLGTGPFMLTDFVSNSQAIFTRNPNYWETDPGNPGNRLPYLEEVRVLIIPDPAVREAAFRTRVIDSLSGLYPDDALALINDPEYAAVEYLEYMPDGTYSMFFRTDLPESPFSIKEVRQAMMLAIDQPAIRDQYWQGHAEILAWPVTPTPAYMDAYCALGDLPAATQALYGRDLTAAQALLDTTPYPDGFDCSVICWGNPVMLDILSIYQNSLADIGINMMLDVVDYAVYINRSRARNHTAFEILYTTDSANSTYLKMIDFRGQNSYNGSYIDWDYSVPEIEAAYAAIQPYVGINEPAMMAIHHDLMPWLLDQAYAINSPAPYMYNLWWPWVKNHYGTTNIGYYSNYSQLKYLWIDQELKGDMGY